jgi:hypothetical protein
MVGASLSNHGEREYLDRHALVGAMFAAKTIQEQCGVTYYGEMS